MKDVYAVLRQKELQKTRLEDEVEALRETADSCWKTGKSGK